MVILRDSWEFPLHQDAFFFFKTQLVIMCRHSKNHQFNSDCKPIFNVYTTHLKMFQLQISIQSSLWSRRVYLDDTEANYKQWVMFYVSSFSPIASNPMEYLLWTLSLCSQAEPSTLLLLCSHTLAMFLSNPLIIHVFAFLHILKHMSYTGSTLGAEAMEPPLTEEKEKARGS